MKLVEDVRTCGKVIYHNEYDKVITVETVDGDIDVIEEMLYSLKEGDRVEIYVRVKR